MSIQILPVSNQNYSFDYNVELDGTVYNFAYFFNRRLSRWLLSIADEFGNKIVSGIVLANGVSLLAAYPELPLPPGSLSVWDSTGTKTEADNNNFGVTVFLVYVEAAGP